MAEIGRISGPLLKENLLRDEVNLRVESNLLYFDVNTHAADVSANPSDPSAWTGRLGIHNPNPAYQLDVVGTTRSNALLIKPNLTYTNAYADIDNIRLDGNRIQAIAGNLELSGATLTDRVQINTNTLIDANLEVTGNITLGGSINIGDQESDEVIFGADVASSILPDTGDTYDLGSETKAWRNIYATNIEITGNLGLNQIVIEGNRISTVESNADLEFDTAGTGRYVFIGTGGVILPVGNTAERPTPPEVGMMRFNTDDQRVENYNGEEWNRMIHDDDAIAFAIALG